MDQRRVNRSDDETGIVCPNCGKEMRLKERKPPKRVVIQCPDPLCGVTEERSSAELNL